MKEVKIGNQVWAKEDLKVTRFQNGDLIPVVQDRSEWSKLRTAAMCFTENGNALYNWYAVDDSRGLCPAGWHVPSDGEWTELTDYLGGKVNIGGKMKSSAADDPSWNGSNSSGFSALPGGDRSSSGNFGDVGNYGCWWSSTSYHSDYAWYRILYSTSNNLYREHITQRYGISVRCIKNNSELSTMKEEFEYGELVQVRDYNGQEWRKRRYVNTLHQPSPHPTFYFTMGLNETQENYDGSPIRWNQMRKIKPTTLEGRIQKLEEELHQLKNSLK